MAKTQQRGVKDDRDLRTLSKASGIPVAELRERIAKGREQVGREETEKRAAQRAESIRFNVAQVSECLSDADDMADALRHGDYGRMTHEAVAHGIFAICGRAAEFLRELRHDLGIED